MDIRLGWALYARVGSIEARPYVPGEDLTGVSVSAEDTPTAGGLIARNPANHKDQWYIDPDYFVAHYRLIP